MQPQNSNQPRPPRPVAAMIVMFALATVTLSVAAAPRADLWPMWEQSNPASTRQVDHGTWSDILEEFLVTGDPGGINLFRYADTGPATLTALQDYIGKLTALDPRDLDRAEQFAYWINLYNAQTVRLVLEHYPVDSIRRIRSGLFSFGPWDRKDLTIAGQALSLNDIEHRILRPIWRDERIHFAANCASLGCPHLQPEAFTAANSNDLLDRAAREFMNHPRALEFRSGNSVVLSSIFDWYLEDFAPSEAGLKTALGKYLTPDRAARLASHDGDIDYEYDWSLNEPAD